MRVSQRVIFSAILVLLLLSLSLDCIASKADIKVGFWDHGETNRRVYEEVIARFNASQDRVNAIPDPIPGDIGATVLARIAGGTGPDVLWWTTNGLPWLVLQDAIIDLSPYIKRDNFDLNDFFNTSLDGFKFYGKQYGLPLVAPVSGFVYNMDLFDAAAVDHPTKEWTWNDVLIAAQKLVRRDATGKAQVFGISGFFGFFEKGSSFTPVMWAYGGKLFDRIDFPTKSHVTSKGVVDAITYVRDLRFKYKVAPQQNELSRLGGTDYFIAGETAMTFAKPNLAIAMKDAKANIRWNATLMPKGPGGRGAGGNSEGMCILSSSKHPDAAWEFLKFITSKEGFLVFDKILGTGGSFPPRKSALKEIIVNYPDKNINVTAFMESIEYTLPFMYRLMQGYDIWSPIGDALTKIYSGEMDVLPAMQQAHPILENILKRHTEEFKKVDAARR